MVRLNINTKCFKVVSQCDNKYLSWVYGVDRKICHEGH